VNFAGMKACLNGLPAGSIIVLHACCHNPTGADLSDAQWAEVVELCRNAAWCPSSTWPTRASPTASMPTPSPCAPSRRLRPAVLRFQLVLQELLAVRRARRRPVHRHRRQGRIGPRHVAGQARHPHQLLQPADPRRRVVAAVLSTPELRQQWETELAGMRDRIRAMRTGLVDAIKAARRAQDFSFVIKQRGMFSYTGLTAAQVDRMRLGRVRHLRRQHRPHLPGRAEHQE
jgi:aromatic-amino-acid transaminase